MGLNFYHMSLLEKKLQYHKVLRIAKSFTKMQIVNHCFNPCKSLCASSIQVWNSADFNLCISKKSKKLFFTKRRISEIF